MNLITDSWLPIIRKDGSSQTISICNLVSQHDTNPVVEIVAPRPDFRNAIYQMIIGLLHVALMPDDEEDWYELFETPPSEDDFVSALDEWSQYFNIVSNGPAFMQDYALPDGEEKPIARLLIDAPGGKTVKDNLDFFIKRDAIDTLNPYWAAIALYTLQTFASGGGVGNRVGVRGGGPLTTLLKINKNGTLWKNLWINTISKEKMITIPGDHSLKEPFNILPWLSPTKESDIKGSELLPQECHPMHVFFAMPRRIRFSNIDTDKKCSITGLKEEIVITSFRTKNYGNNYSGPWIHPLNAYDHSDPKEPPRSIKGSPGGIRYRHWLGLVLPSVKITPATVISLLKSSEYRKEIVKHNKTVVWAAGYDMDNMKARNWYESLMPIYDISKNFENELATFIESLIDFTAQFSKDIKSSIKEAWTARPKDMKGDIGFIDQNFWNSTENAFYKLLDEIITNECNQETKKHVIDDWSKTLKQVGLNLFDQYALAEQEEGLDMKRVIRARNKLHKAISKTHKQLHTLKGVEE